MQGLDLTDFEDQFMSEIVTGLDEYYICRKKDCLFVGLNTDWIENGGQYRCPSCTTRYQPWVQGQGLIPAQKMLVVHPHDTLDTALGSMEKGAVNFYLMEWQETSTQTLTNKFKEIALSLNEEIKNLTGEQLLFVLRDLVRNTGQRGYFKHMEVSPMARSQIDHLNQQGRNVERPWKLEHLRDGYKGNFYKYKEGENILTYDDVMRLWGYSLFLVKKSSSRL